MELGSGTFKIGPAKAAPVLATNATATALKDFKDDFI